MEYLKEKFVDFFREESGMGVVEVILIIVVLISLVVIFKSQITDVVNKIMKSIKKDSKSIYAG
ncbi:MAG: Flp1 family type IVb pilin [Lachnospiraceae bacterium]|nr:Flp1 family type IVb pilin [Lachnospiraceae bacterium]